jgi:serine/threonine-protein kinase
MDVEVVRVWIGDPNSGGIFNGTAFFINSNTLITSKHVVQNYIDKRIYINTLSDGSTLPIEEIKLCPRDIALLKIKRLIKVPTINFTTIINQEDEVKIKGFDDNPKTPVNHLSHKVSGYEGEHHTYRLQNYIAEGYSGSPVFIGNKLCGLVQAVNENKNLTYIIPIEECCSSFVEQELKKTMRNHIFINSTYSEKYLPIIQDFSNKLTDLGHKVYHSKKDNLGKNFIELKSCKYFILFLSEETFVSEIVIEKIKEIKKLQIDSLFPAIIPIRLNLDEEYNINYDLSRLIDEIEPFQWQNSDDTDDIAKKIDKLIVSGDIPKKSKKRIELSETDIPVPNARLLYPNGKEPYDSEYYIEREEDRECYDALFGTGERLIRIKAPQQFGKTSLISRLVNRAEEDYYIIELNFKHVEMFLFESIRNLLNYLFDEIVDELNIEEEDRLDDKVLNKHTFISGAKRYMEKILELSDKKILLIIDDADKLFQYEDTSNDFFAFIRALHQYGQGRKKVWKKLNIILSHSTDASFATKYITNSPFHNVGFGVVLKSFTREEINILSKRHNISLNNRSLNKFINLIGGHPFLSRLTLYHMSKKRKSLRYVLNSNIYKGHMQRYMWKINEEKEYKQILKDIADNLYCKKIKNKKCFILESFGLIKDISTDRVDFTCKLYRDFFKKNL